MKGNDNLCFWALIIFALLLGGWIYDSSFEGYSDLITFLSIMVGFKITSFSILFNSPLKKTLYDRKIQKYGTELHRLKDFYKHSLFFEVISILLLFLMPDDLQINLYFKTIILGRHLLVLPILVGVFYCFYKVYYDLLKIFAHPTNN
jgi:hypothetical protein